MIIPAFNEAGRLPETIRAVMGTRLVDEVIVVDDGSTDDTGAVSGREGARVIRFDKNQGKGRALTEGVRAARGDVIVLLDADLGAKAIEFTKLLDPVVSRQVDLTIAKFPAIAGKRGGFGLAKGLGTAGIRALTGRSFDAPLSGQRVARKEVLESILPFSSGWGAEVGMTVDALRAGYRVIEVETTMAHRATGRDLSGFLHRGRQLLHVAYALACRIFPGRFPGGRFSGPARGGPAN